MKISIVTPNYNGAVFLEQTVRSVLAQRGHGVTLQYIVMDGGSTDGSLDILQRYSSEIDCVVSEPDDGAASAINRGLARADGELLAWLNADDVYAPGALRRVVACMQQHPAAALCFGHCPIVNEQGHEIRQGITRFKEAFYPVSSRFAIQCINYISQPAMVFRRSAFEQAGPLREDLMCAWDYEFILRLWRHGGGVCLSRPPLAAFRWHAASLSGRHFRRQFKEEWEAAARDAGWLSPQALLHLGVRWGIVSIYSLMALRRRGAARPSAPVVATSVSLADESLR